MRNRTPDQRFKQFLSTGDAGALAAVFDAVAPELLSVARHLSGDELEAEDALQATFQTAIEKRDQWDPKRRLVPWLLGILTLHAKKERERSERTPDPWRMREQLVCDPATAASESEIQELVEAKVADLPETYSAAVRSYLREDKAPREIAQMLGISTNAASVRLHRGLAMLRRALPAAALLGGAGSLSARGLPAIRAQVLRGAEGLPVTGPGGAGGLGSLVASLATRRVAALAGLFVATAGVVTVVPLLEDGTAETRAADAAPLRLMAEESSAAKDPVPTSDDRQALAPRAEEVARTAGAVEAAPLAVPSAEEWLRRLTDAPDWRAALAIGWELGALEPDVSLAILREIYHRVPNPSYRQQLLKPFYFRGGQSNAIDVIHLAATDADMEVQGWAFRYLRDYAFRDFSQDYDAYLAWYGRVEGRDLGEVLTESALDMSRRVSRASGSELSLGLAELGDLDLGRGPNAGVDLAEELRAAGLLDAISRWMVVAPLDVRVQGLRWIAELGPSEEFLWSHVVPRLRDPERTPAEVRAACDTLGSSGGAWAVEPLVELARSTTAVDRPTLYAPFQALADLGDATAIPVLIGLLASEPEGRWNYAIGYFGLSKLTGVTWNEGLDATFWLDWWERNQARLPLDVRGSEIPRFALAD